MKLCAKGRFSRKEAQKIQKKLGKYLLSICTFSPCMTVWQISCLTSPASEGEGA